ncbi:MAG: DUF3575 domain-containing protein [Bacteroidales bacterium]|nr:DUF3575 domain-containing protein [Bacteroidales bacterium]
MKKLLFTTSVLIGMIFLTGSAGAQEDHAFPDSVKFRKNVIKWNLTPFVLWSKKNVNIGYERILSPYRSFSVNTGYFELPALFTGMVDSLNIQGSRNKGGLSFSGDYRYYFKNRNKKTAPDGLYWGIFASYYHYRFENDITVINSAVIQGNIQFGARLNIFNAGLELGYQFVLWKDRMTIDLIFLGPSLSLYAKKFTLGGELDIDSEDEYLKAIYDILSKSVPGFEQLVNDGEISTSGVNVSMGFGLRYMVQIGFRF